MHVWSAEGRHQDRGWDLGVTPAKAGDGVQEMLVGACRSGRIGYVDSGDPNVMPRVIRVADSPTVFQLADIVDTEGGVL